MKKTNTYGLVISILLFVIFIVLAIVFESIDYLYAASLLPIFIVVFLPDIRSGQYLKAAKHGNRVRLIKLQGNEAAPDDLFIIAFEPGYVNWQRSILYFDIADAVTYAELQPESYTASMAILKYDLKLHPSKNNWIGVSLNQVVQRTKQLSYTTNEINRLVIQMQDIHELQQQARSKHTSAGSSLQA